VSHTVITLWGDEHEQEDGMTEPMTQPVPRRPGWVLIATTSGTRGYHRVKTRGTLGTLVTVCGVTGHKVEEYQRSIIECPDCNA